MSAGEDIAEAHKHAAQACGILAGMLARKRLQKSGIASARALIEQALGDIDRALPPAPSGDTVSVPSIVDSSGEDDGSPNSRR